VKGVEDRKKLEGRKKIIQQEIRDKLGLIVDIPRQGAGNCNVGNTARTFFRNTSVTATDRIRNSLSASMFCWKH